MTTHDLKIWPTWFEAIATGEKTFEVRRNDRNYKPGDVLLLRAWDPARARYTGPEMRCAVDYVSYAQFGQPPGIDQGFCVMAIRRLDPLATLRIDQAEESDLAAAETYALDQIAVAQHRIYAAVNMARDIRAERFQRGIKGRRRPRAHRKEKP